MMDVVGRNFDRSQETKGAPAPEPIRGHPAGKVSGGRAVQGNVASYATAQVSRVYLNLRPHHG
jgi:hypothetical protein